MTLKCFVDLGSSGTKIFTLKDDKIGFLLMPPAIMQVSPARLEETVSINRGAASVDATAWIQLTEPDCPIAVGKLAEQMGGDPGLPQRKSDPGIYRILAAIGVLRNLLDLPAALAIELGIALPIAEYADRKAFKETLESITTWGFQEQVISAEWKLIDIQAEGTGLIRHKRMTMMNQHQPASKIVALMAGHRNLSLVRFDDTINDNGSRSDGPGFRIAVEVAAKQIGIEPDTPGLLEAVGGNSKQLRVQGSLKPLDISTGVEEGRRAYLQQVMNYLNSYMPGEGYELIGGGGAAWSMQKELQASLSEYGLSINFLDELRQFVKEVTGHYVSGRANDSTLEERLQFQLGDGIMGFQSLLAKSAKTRRAEQQQTANGAAKNGTAPIAPQVATKA